MTRHNKEETGKEKCNVSIFIIDFMSTKYIRNLGINWQAAEKSLRSNNKEKGSREEEGESY